MKKAISDVALSAASQLIKKKWMKNTEAVRGRFY